MSPGFRDTDNPEVLTSCLVPDKRSKSLINSSSFDFKKIVFDAFALIVFSTSSPYTARSCWKLCSTNVICKSCPKAIDVTVSMFGIPFSPERML